MVHSEMLAKVPSFHMVANIIEITIPQVISWSKSGASRARIPKSEKSILRTLKLRKVSVVIISQMALGQRRRTSAPSINTLILALLWTSNQISASWASGQTHSRLKD